MKTPSHASDTSVTSESGSAWKKKKKLIFAENIEDPDEETHQ